MDRSGQRPGGRGQISDSLARLGNRYVVDMSMLFFFFWVLFWTIAKNRGERGERR